jgi:hypothetical protein
VGFVGLATWHGLPRLCFDWVKAGVTSHPHGPMVTGFLASLIAFARVARLRILRRNPTVAKRHDTARDLCMEYFPCCDAGFSTVVKGRRQRLVMYGPFRGIWFLRKFIPRSFTAGIGLDL